MMVSRPMNQSPKAIRDVLAKTSKSQIDLLEAAVIFKAKKAQLEVSTKKTAVQNEPAVVTGTFDAKGQPHGFCKVEVGIAVYYGQFRNGQFRGQGVLLRDDGVRVDGMWHDGWAKTLGRLYVNDQLCYEGQLVGQQPHGKGNLHRYDKSGAYVETTIGTFFRDRMVKHKQPVTTDPNL
jgi:hypothetical protein